MRAVASWFEVIANAEDVLPLDMFGAKRKGRSRVKPVVGACEEKNELVVSSGVASIAHLIEFSTPRAHYCKLIQPPLFLWRIYQLQQLGGPLDYALSVQIYPGSCACKSLHLMAR